MADKVCFGVYELDRDARELRKRGVLIRLQDQPFRVLAILTGILLAVARIAGETAPLLFTSLGNSNYSGLGSAMASLPIAIYQYASSAFDDWVQLAWTGALLITLGVLTLNILARLIVRRR